MPSSFYYVYALKDPRRSPSKPFYIGKGTGSRLDDHVLRIDNTAKGKRIQEIIDAGHRPVAVKLVDKLTEAQALMLEAEMISALGVENCGGLLTNSVGPTFRSKAKRRIILPSGAQEKAQIGLTLLKSAVLELVDMNPDGVRNSDVASSLGLRSDYQGKQKDYLSYSVLGLLLRERSVKRENGRHKSNK